MNNKTLNDGSQQNDLDWLAFCYSAGELSPADAQAFEVRLADEQAARESLARAVELSQAIAAAETQSDYAVSPAVRTKDWSSRLSWMAVGGVASLLLALLWSGIVGPTRTAKQRKMNAASQQQLALAWNATRGEIAEVREAGLWLPSSASWDDDLTTDMPLDELESDESPSWLTAAVFARARDDSEEPANRFSNERLEN